MHSLICALARDSQTDDSIDSLGLRLVNGADTVVFDVYDMLTSLAAMRLAKAKLVPRAAEDVAANALCGMCVRLDA